MSMCRCAACDEILEDGELYRKGARFDMCYVCIPYSEEEEVDVLLQEAEIQAIYPAPKDGVEEEGPLLPDEPSIP